MDDHNSLPGLFLNKLYGFPQVSHARNHDRQQLDVTISKTEQRIAFCTDSWITAALDLTAGAVTAIKA